jgi:2-succinyl-5-enolpyruvyl-6-hydroxy-3-cyclohexene-1-carboxylate synthase
VVVFDNAGGGIFEFLPQARALEREEFETLFGTPSGLSCERAAALWGLPYRRLESAGELAAGGPDRPEIVEIPVDRLAGVGLRDGLMGAAADAATRSLRSLSS